MHLVCHGLYLSNRTQQVVVNNPSSNTDDVVCGIPQESILCSHLFSLFINDLPLSMKNSPISVDLYADDTTSNSTSIDKCSLETNLKKGVGLSLHLVLRKW